MWEILWNFQQPIKKRKKCRNFSMLFGIHNLNFIFKKCFLMTNCFISYVCSSFSESIIILLDWLPIKLWDTLTFLKMALPNRSIKLLGLKRLFLGSGLQKNSWNSHNKIITQQEYLPICTYVCECSSISLSKWSNYPDSIREILAMFQKIFKSKICVFYFIKYFHT